MKGHLLIIKTIVLFVSTLALRAQTIPDSLTKGVLIKCYEVRDKDINTVENPKLGALVNTIYTEQAGVADWKSNYAFVPAPGKPYYLFMTGYMLIRESKSYVFNLQGTDGSVLFIDSKQIVKNDGVHDFKEQHAEHYLEKGLHAFEIRAFNNNQHLAHEISLAWNGATTNPEAFDWMSGDILFRSKKASSGAKQNSSGDAPEPISDNKVKDYTNSVHPSFDDFSLHDSTFKPRVGGLDFLSNGNLIVCTWDSLGQVFELNNIPSANPKQIKVKRIAWGLSEPLGLKVVDDKIYVLQKHELTQLVDTDGDGIIDEYKTICNAWGAIGNFHEFAFGLIYKDGFFYATLSTAIFPGGKSVLAQNKDRGKAVKIGMNGSFEILASGLRTPNGIGFGVDDEMFIADNQGDWLPACKIVHLKKGAFYGNYSVNMLEVGKFIEKPPVVWLPQGEIGNSASQPAQMKDGPYAGQMMHGDVTHGGLKRVFVEKIDGEYQGIVFPFTQGLEAGVNRLVWGPDGALYIGGVGSTGNWSQFGKKWYGLEKLKYNNKPTFEILAVRAKANGMEIEFTQPLNAKYGNNPADYAINHWTYIPTMNYGGPKVDPGVLNVLSVNMAKDRKKVFLELEGMKEGYVVYINLPKTWESIGGLPIWANKGWYTLNRIPTEKGVVLVPRPANATMKVAANTAKPVAKPAVKELTDKEILTIGPALIDESGCLQCHAADRVVLGPSFKMINGKYDADPATLAKLVEKVYKGGSGVWGDQAMGANTHLDKADIKKLVRYILLMPK